MKKNNYIAKTMFGLEKVLADEIIELGGRVDKIQNRAVSFGADLATLYRINLASRLSLRILNPILTFRAKNAESLYKLSQKYDWTKLFNYDDAFVVDSVVNSRYFKHSKYAALKLKDAIVDQFRAKKGKRPNIRIDDPDFRFNLHIVDDLCTISLDASGESLHKRGYRLKSVKAPLNEVLAAGMITLSGWDKESNFVDPMCGSGTIILEATMIALNIPPNINRKKFGFEKWGNFDPILLKTVKNNLNSKRKPFNF
ncbi:MAG: THUMP domain-containing protein, partial [Melioribacteraceae bacterium]|nr:THUMP domain-containing protein [Melioribacteraceae bacterium]